jgi:hypothetical protein
MDYGVLRPSRNWREIANELLHEPNTERMARLLAELNRVSAGLFEWQKQDDATLIQQLRLNPTQRTEPTR